MTYIQKEMAVPASTAIPKTQLTFSNNTALAYQGQHHPDGAGRTCATCRAGCVVGSAHSHMVMVQCRMHPEFDTHDAGSWCLQWAPRVPAPPTVRARR